MLSQRLFSWLVLARRYEPEYACWHRDDLVADWSGRTRGACRVKQECARGPSEPAGWAPLDTACSQDAVTRWRLRRFPRNYTLVSRGPWAGALEFPRNLAAKLKSGGLANAGPARGAGEARREAGWDEGVAHSRPETWDETEGI